MKTTGAGCEARQKAGEGESHVKFTNKKVHFGNETWKLTSAAEELNFNDREKVS